MDIRVAVESESEIKNLYSPSHAVEIKRPDDKHAVISFSAKEYVPSADFRLLYDVGPGKIGTSALSYRPSESEEGYFMLLTSPQINSPDMTPPRKTVIFVLDRSGSMAGVKLEQAKGALKYVLNNLREGDTFNIVAYDGQVESFRPEMQRFNDEMRKAATGYVEGLYPGGGTNIDGALKTAMAHLQDPSQPSYVIFLTDGLPTVGETKEAAIVANAKANNKVRARVFAFGVGYDVNARMLDSLVGANFGQSEYVRPNENIEERVSRFYAKIGAPVMTDVKIAIEMDGVKPEEGPVVNRVYPKESIDLFAGQQLVVVGRYRKAGAAKVTVTGKIGMTEQKFDFPATFVEKSPDSSNVFIERIWAMRRVGEIIDEIDHKGKNDELIKELVTLATKHGILTQYTSFIAEEPGVYRELGAATRRAEERLDLLKEADGVRGVAQRASKGALRRADAPAQQEFAKAEDRKRGALPAVGAAGGAFRDEQDKEVETANVRCVDAKTFYRRGDQWVESTVSEAAEKKAQKVACFSQQYFDLAAKHGQRLTRYLVANEPVVLELDGEVFAFEAASK
jgi:Ca-activated chloride channel family protein